MAKKRNRAKHTATFEERLAEQAQKFMEAANKLPNGSKARDWLLQRARQVETASDINKWLSSPERQPTGALEDFLAGQKK
jgi:hypothetical protein